MKQKRNVPALRFRGFSGEWKSEKLSDMCIVFTDGDWIEASDQSKSGIRLIQTGNIGVTRYFDKPENKKWISEETFDRLRCTAVLPGDILISRLPDPAGRACIVPNLGTKMVTAVDCTIARVEKSDDKEFLVQYLATDKYFEKVSEALAGGTRQRISRSNLANFSVPIPPIPNEQYQIGRTLTQCDLFISQARCRIRKLEQFRQAMLEKLFPREGETEPELRFRGFSGPWQKKFVRDITKATYGGGTPSTSRSEFWTGDIPWIQSSDISENDIWHVFPKKCISQQALTLTAAQKIPANSIALVTRVGVGKLAFMPFPYTTSQDFLSLSNLVTDGYFTTCALQKKMAEDMTIVQGTSIKGVTKDEILTKVIAVPTNISEQKKIGDFFHQLDSYISLQKEKLDKLHRLKAALLDKLFV